MHQMCNKMQSEFLLKVYSDLIKGNIVTYHINVNDFLFRRNLNDKNISEILNIRTLGVKLGAYLLNKELEMKF